MKALSPEDRAQYWIWRRSLAWREQYGEENMPEEAKLHTPYPGPMTRLFLAKVQFAAFANHILCESTFNVRATWSLKDRFYAGRLLSGNSGEERAAFIREQIPASSADLPHYALNASRRWRGQTWGCAYDGTP